MKTLLAALACWSLAVLCRTEAQNSVSFNLGAPGETITDQLIYSNNGLTATATAWSRPVSGGMFEQSQLAQWSPGIGVKSAGEVITSVPYVPFYTDNETYYDFVLFVFDRPVEIDQVKVHPSGNTFDLDVSYWLGNIDPSLDLAGAGFNDLSGLGFGPRIDDDVPAGNAARWVNVNSNTGGINALLVGARVSGDSGIDRFKIQTLDVTPAIPEPASALMSILGIPMLMRRKVVRS